MADPVVSITNGVPTSGTGTITTLGQTLIDGANATLGITTGAAVTTSAAGTIQGYLRGIVSLLVSGITVASHAVTNTGTFAVQAAATLAAETTKIIGVVKLSDGTNTATVKAASTAPVATDTGVVVSIHPLSVNGNGQAVMSASAPVVLASNQTSIPVAATTVDPYSQYETVAASATTQAMGATGATGDYLAGVLVFPGTAVCGVVTIFDNATQIGQFAGGGTTALPSLVPFMIPVGLFSVSGAWKITTGANVTAVGIGKFT